MWLLRPFGSLSEGEEMVGLQWCQDQGCLCSCKSSLLSISKGRLRCRGVWCVGHPSAAPGYHLVHDSNKVAKVQKLYYHLQSKDTHSRSSSGSISWSRSEDQHPDDATPMWVSLPAVKATDSLLSWPSVVEGERLKEEEH